MPRVWALVDNATVMLRALYADETAACRENIALGWICTVQSWAVIDGEELARYENYKRWAEEQLAPFEEGDEA